MSSTTPVLVGDAHLDLPLPELNTDGRHRGARLLAWLYGQLIGEVQLSLNACRGVNFPRELVCRERMGVVVGPFAYAVSRWRHGDRTGVSW